MEESIRTLLLDEANLPEVIICSDAEQTWCVYQSIVDFNMVGKLEIIEEMIPIQHLLQSVEM